MNNHTPACVCPRCKAEKLETKDFGNILREAEHLVGGDRADDYGDIAESFKRTSLIWSGILHIDVTPKQVALCMAGLKLSRESRRHKRDNNVDGVAYLHIAQILEDG